MARVGLIGLLFVWVALGQQTVYQRLVTNSGLPVFVFNQFKNTGSDRHLFVVSFSNASGASCLDPVDRSFLGYPYLTLEGSFDGNFWYRVPVTVFSNNSTLGNYSISYEALGSHSRMRVSFSGVNVGDCRYTIDYVGSKGSVGFVGSKTTAFGMPRIITGGGLVSPGNVVPCLGQGTVLNTAEWKGLVVTATSSGRLDFNYRARDANGNYPLDNFTFFSVQLTAGQAINLGPSEYPIGLLHHGAGLYVSSPASIGATAYVACIGEMR